MARRSSIALFLATAGLMTGVAGCGQSSEKPEGGENGTTPGLSQPGPEAGQPPATKQGDAKQGESEAGEGGEVGEGGEGGEG